MSKWPALNFCIRGYEGTCWVISLCCWSEAGGRTGALGMDE